MHAALAVEQTPARLLPPALLAKTEDPQADLFAVVDLTLPTGTERYAEAGVPTSVGHFEGRITGMGTVSRGISPRSNDLQDMELTVSFADTDRRFAKILEGSQGRRVRKSAARCRIMSPGLPESDWWTVFSGVISSWQQRGLEWMLRLRPNDAQLDTFTPKVAITDAIYPNAKVEAYDEYMPLVYGKHSSTGMSGVTGMLPTLYVDTVEFRYLICQGQIKAVNKVYVDGVDTASGWAFEVRVVNGVTVSEINFTSDQAAAAITVDVDGYEHIGNGNGDVITNPAQQLAHFLEHFVWRDYRTGRWQAAPSAAPLDYNLFAEAGDYFARHNVQGARYISATSDSRNRGRDILLEWISTWHALKAFWTNAGKLAVRPLDHFVKRPYPAEQWIRHDLHDLEGSFTPATDVQQITDRVSVQWKFGAADDKYYSSFDVQDIAVDEESSLKVEMPWGAASNIGLEVARHNGSGVLRLFRQPTDGAGIKTPLRFADVEICDLVQLTHDLAPTADGAGFGRKVWQRGLYYVLGHETDPQSKTTVLKLLEAKQLGIRHWETGIGDISGGTSGPGSARLDTGGSRTMARASTAWFESPGDRTLIGVASDVLRVSADGYLIEQAATATIIENGFKNGAGNTFTGWTAAGTGSNGSAIVQDTTEGVFQTYTRSVRFVSGSPIHVADLKLTSTATASQPANSLHRASLYYRNDTGNVLYYAVQRGVDSNYWRESDQTWQVAIQWNPLPSSTTRRRYSSKRIDVGGSATTLTGIVGVPTASGVAGQNDHLYHFQLEAERYATSPILTETTEVTRALDDYMLANDHGQRRWEPALGSITFGFIPLWAAGDLADTGTRTLFDVTWDPNNYERIDYDQDNARLRFRRVLAGVTYTAFIAWVPVRDTLYRIGTRWTGVEAEHGLAAYTISVFLAGVKGTDAVPGGSVVSIPTHASVLNYDGANQNIADGYFRDVEIWPWALTDTEFARLAQ